MVGVLTRPDAPAGRGRTWHPSPVAEFAAERGLPVFKPARPSEPEFLGALVELAPDCCPVVAYGALIPSAALDIPRHGWVNLHFSLLPAWRGAAPVQRAVMAGDDLTGATTFRLEAGMDTGPLYGVVTEEIRPTDTAGDLLERLSQSGAQLLARTVDGIASGELRPAPQPPEGVSLAPKVTVEDARVRWTEPAFGVDRRIRGCTPEPGAWTTFRGDRIKLSPVTLEPGADPLPPGTLRVERSAVLAGTATVPVRLGTMQPPGKRPMAAADWARGARPGADEGLS